MQSFILMNSQLIHLDKHGFIHDIVSHADKVYVINDVHVNNIEGFWSLLKGGINGVYHSVNPQH